MESIGTKLQNARQERNISLEQAARETHISKRFIEAFESEDYSVFPAESYIIGLLRSYSSYLDFNSDDIVALYRNTQIQETAPPMEELIGAKGPRPLSIIGISLVVVILAVAAVILATSSPDGGPAVVEVEPDPEPVALAQADFVFDTFLETNFDNGTSIEINGTTGTPSIVVLNIASEDSLSLSGDGIETTELQLRNPSTIDVDGDGQKDLSALLTSIEPDANRFVLRLSASLDLQTLIPRVEGTASLDVEGRLVLNPVEPPNQLASRQRSTEILAWYPSYTFINGEIEVQSPVYVRFQVDEDPAEEGFMATGESFRVQARESLSLWIADGSKVLVKVNGNELAQGSSGEVLTYQLVMDQVPQTEEHQLEIVPLF